TALTSALLQVINALSVALLTTFLVARPSYKAGQRLLSQLQGQAQAATAHTLHVGHAAATAPPTLLAPIAALFAHAFDDMFALLAIIGLIAGLLGLALPRQTAAQRAAVVLNEEEDVTSARLLLAS